MKMNINEILEGLNNLMYGHNYEVYFGIDIFEGESVDDFERCLKKRHPNVSIDSIEPVIIIVEDLIMDVRKKFDYRGDFASGLELTSENEGKLRNLQEKYFEYISGFFHNEMKCYSYQYLEGIPGDYAFWDFRYVLYLNNNRILFLYGTASD
jgi:hypothetical protein